MQLWDRGRSPHHFYSHPRESGHPGGQRGYSLDPRLRGGDDYRVRFGCSHILSVLKRALIAVFTMFAAHAALANDAVKIGVVKNSVYGPLFVAESRGYFKTEKLDATLVVFDSALLMGPAVAAGSIDFAGGNATAAIYNLGGQGVLRIIAGFAEDAPGFQLFAFVASNRAYDAGLKSFAALPGHSVAIQSLGAAAAYILSLIDTKYHLDPATTRLLALQSNSNMISAVTGGTADSFVGPATQIMPVVKRGEVKLIAYTGDEVKWQLGTIYTATKTANDRHDVVERFLAAYRKGVHDYDDAFVDAAGTRARQRRRAGDPRHSVETSGSDAGRAEAGARLRQCRGEARSEGHHAPDRLVQKPRHDQARGRCGRDDRQALRDTAGEMIRRS